MKKLRVAVERLTRAEARLKKVVSWCFGEPRLTSKWCVTYADYPIAFAWLKKLFPDDDFLIVNKTICVAIDESIWFELVYDSNNIFKGLFPCFDSDTKKRVDTYDSNNIFKGLFPCFDSDTKKRVDTSEYTYWITGDMCEDMQSIYWHIKDEKLGPVLYQTLKSGSYYNGGLKKEAAALAFLLCNFTHMNEFKTSSRFVQDLVRRIKKK